MKAHLRQLIARGKTLQAIQELLQITERSGDPNLYHEVILQSGRFETYLQADRRGTLTVEEKDTSLAQVHDALLTIIEQLEGEEQISPPPTKTTDPSEPPFKAKWWPWVVALSVLITLPAGLAEFSGYSLRDWWEGRTLDAFSVTVLVHGKKGKGDRILRNQGKVILDIGDTREEERIDAKGQATFKGLSLNYRNQKAVISIDHPQPYFPTNRNAEYLLTDQRSIYLEVQLEGLGKIHGRILDYENELPLDSVRVSVQNSATYTDVFGWYELEIPPTQQAKFVKVTFYKAGYQLAHFDSIAPHTGQEIGYSLQKIDQ